MNRNYFSLFCLILLFSFMIFAHKNSEAGVYFITKAETVTSQSDEKPCQVLGYTVTAKSCEAKGQSLTGLCPKDSNYGKECSCSSQYKFDKTNCTGNKTLGGNVCGDKYETCDCNKNVYKYFSNADCETPKTLNYANSCTYNDKKVGVTECSCSSDYSQTCSGNFVGVNTSCGGKYQSCKCNSTFVKCNYGGATGATECSDTEGKKYNNCKQPSCVEGGYETSVPSGQTCTSVSYNGLTCYKDCKASCDGYTKDTYCSPVIGMSRVVCPNDSTMAKCVFSCATYKEYILSEKTANENDANRSYESACGRLCHDKPIWPRDLCQASWNALMLKAADYKTKCGETISMFARCATTSCRDGMQGIDLCGTDGGGGMMY